MPMLLVILFVLCAAPAVSSAQWVVVQTGAPTEFRGLDAAGPDVVWATGRGGWFVRSADGGASWSADTIPGASNLFLVDVHALSADAAHVLATSFDGGLARIYHTADAGRTWQVQFEDARAGAFYDGFAFWEDGAGVAFGDPVDGVFTVVVTRDGGTTWRPVPASALPAPLEGEAGFAASGRAIEAAGTGRAWFGTGGGPVARVIRTTDYGASWSAVETPLPGGSSAGIFALDFATPETGLAAGGDYQQPSASGTNVLRTSDGGTSWTAHATTAPTGVKYGIAHAPGTTTWTAVAPAGASHSGDGGLTWTDLGLTGFNTVHYETLNAGWMAGTDGRIAVLRRP